MVEENPSPRSRGWRREAIKLQIQTNEKNIEDGFRRRHELNQALNDTTVIMALPLEILTDIFRIVNENQLCGPDRYQRLPVPFLLGKICMAWRNIVWSTPTLWNTITIRFGKRADIPPIDLLSGWITRSANVPLHIDLSAFFEPGRAWHPPTVGVFRVLLSTSSRWKTLSTPPFPVIQQGALQTKFPLLSTLNIDSSRVKYPPDHPPFRFPAAQICNLELNNIDTKSGIKMEWKTLRSLKATLSIANCFLALRAASASLRFCMLYVMHDADGHELGSTPVILPHLTGLNISSRHGTISRCLRMLTLPALAHLNINMASSQDQAWATSLLDLLKRSNCQLIELLVLQANINAPNLLSLLKNIPSLKAFTLTSKESLLNDEAVTGLTPKADTNEVYLPNLQTFNYRGPISFNPQLMKSMLRARIRRFQAGAGRRSEVISIHYTNASWGRNLDPNVLQEFYRDVGSLPATRVTFSIAFVQ